MHWAVGACEISHSVGPLRGVNNNSRLCAPCPCRGLLFAESQGLVVFVKDSTLHGAHDHLQQDMGECKYQIHTHIGCFCVWGVVFRGLSFLFSCSGLGESGRGNIAAGKAGIGQTGDGIV